MKDNKYHFLSFFCIFMQTDLYDSPTIMLGFCYVMLCLSKALQGQDRAMIISDRYVAATVQNWFFIQSDFIIFL